MSAIDKLKEMRQSEPKEKGMDSGEKNETPRTLKLSEEELKSFEQAKPGEDLACEVHGSLTGKDGMFRVMSVSPLNGQGYEDKGMMDQLAQRVTNTTMPSPS